MNWCFLAMLSEQGRMQVVRAMTTSTYNMYIHEGVSTKLNPARGWIDITLAKMSFQSPFSKYETVPSFFCTLLQDKLNYHHFRSFPTPQVSTSLLPKLVNEISRLLSHHWYPHYYNLNSMHFPPKYPLNWWNRS